MGCGHWVPLNVEGVGGVLGGFGQWKVGWGGWRDTGWSEKWNRGEVVGVGRCLVLGLLLLGGLLVCVCGGV